MKYNSEFRRMSDGRMYINQEKSLVRRRMHTNWLCEKYNRARAWNQPRRNMLLKKIFCNSTGKGAFIEPDLHVELGDNVQFGDNFYMNFNCQILDVARITIGHDVMLGPNCILSTPCHPMLAEERVLQQFPDGFHDLEFSKPITIGNNVWFASNVVVCGGVTIGDNVVIGAGSVVVRDIPSNTFACGVPCKVKREITEKDRMNVWKLYEEDNEKYKD